MYRIRTYVLFLLPQAETTITTIIINGDLEPEYVITNETLAKDNPNFFAPTVEPDGTAKANAYEIVQKQKDALKDSGVYLNTENRDQYKKTFEAPMKVVNKTDSYDHTEITPAKIKVTEYQPKQPTNQSGGAYLETHYVKEGSTYLPPADQQQRVDEWQRRNKDSGIWMGGGGYTKIEVDLPVKTIYKAPPPSPPPPAPPSGGGGTPAGGGSANNSTPPPQPFGRLICNTDSSNSAYYNGVWSSRGHPFYDYSGVGCDISTPCGTYLASFMWGDVAHACGKTLIGGAKIPNGGTGWIFVITIK